MQMFFHRQWVNSTRVSLRFKVLLGFSVLFSLVFAGSFYWFYSFTVSRTLARLQSDMRTTLAGAVAGVDVDELLALYATGKRNSIGFSSDPRYLNQIRWLQTVHQIEPRVWLYSYVVLPPQPRQLGSFSSIDRREMVYLVDLWSRYDATKASKFLESEAAGALAYEVMRYQKIVVDREIYTDRWGTWLSAAAPLRDRTGKVVAVLGLDIEANYVLETQRAIERQVLLAFLVIYSLLFGLIYLLSGLLTQRLRKLRQSAQEIGAGRYDLDLKDFSQAPFQDELSDLAQVLEQMSSGICTREQLIEQGKQTEVEMQVALQQEREVNELKSRFVSMVSHDLRTPLTVLRISIELLERYGQTVHPDKKAQYFQRCRSAIDGMDQLIEEVLTLGKAEGNQIQFHPEPIALSQFCASLAEDIQVSTGHVNPIYFYATDPPDWAALDPLLLRSILTNLLSNAVKYSPAGAPIEFELICSAAAVKFIIRDRGIGIPAADQPQIFQQFHRASNAGTIRGTGLGLAIVKQCAKCHGGEVEFSSQEGSGTEFVVTLPLRT